jgi:hypothetical protein
MGNDENKKEKLCGYFPLRECETQADAVTDVGVFR